VDRNDKATLTLTAPRCLIKSFAKDLSLRIVKLHFTHTAGGFFHPPSRNRVLCDSWPRGLFVYDYNGKRSHRPRSRAVQRFATSGFRVRLFSSLGLVVAPPACEPGQDTSATSYPRLHHLAPGLLPLLTERSPGATGLASSLSGCFSFSGQRCRF
jgi:hypothetical protein